MNPMAMRVTEMGASEGCPVTGQIGVASPGWDHLAGSGADFLLVLNSRTFEEPMHEAKQMTTGQPVASLALLVKSVKTIESFPVSFPKNANLPLAFPSSRSITRAPAHHRTSCRFQKGDSCVRQRNSEQPQGGHD
jgi:hypothetical protein